VAEKSQGVHLVLPKMTVEVSRTRENGSQATGLASVEVSSTARRQLR